MVDRILLEGHVGAGLAEAFGGPLGPLGRDELVPAATADEDGLASRVVRPVFVCRCEISVERHDPPVGPGALQERREGRDGALAEPEQSDPIRVEVVGLDRALHELVDRIEAPPEVLGVGLTRVEASRREVEFVPRVARLEAVRPAGAQHVEVAREKLRDGQEIALVRATAVEEDYGGRPPLDGGLGVLTDVHEREVGSLTCSCVGVGIDVVHVSPSDGRDGKATERPADCRRMPGRIPAPARANPRSCGRIPGRAPAKPNRVSGTRGDRYHTFKRSCVIRCHVWLPRTMSSTSS